MNLIKVVLPAEIKASADALKFTPVPSGPSPLLLSSTLAKLSTPKALVYPRENTRRATLATTIGLVAAMLLLFLGIPWSGSLSPAGAFSLIQQKVDQADSVSCLVKYTLFGWRVEMRVTLQGDRIRLEDRYRKYEGSLMNVSSEDQEKHICIIDLRKKLTMTLNPARKTGYEGAVDEVTASDWANPITQIRSLPTGNARRIGSKVVDGKTIEEYVITSGSFLGMPADANCQLQVWVDAATRLPMKIEIRDVNSNESTISFTDFSWNQRVSDQEFPLTLPTDYKFEKPKK